MPTTGEISQFRRLVGDDVASPELEVEQIVLYLNDAAREFTSQSMTALVVTADFDLVAPINKPEVIYTAALNWWWNRAAKLSDKHSQSVGQASQNVGEKFDRAMQMIEMLQTRLDTAAANPANNVITFGNNSRFSKSTLTRIGGVEEEDLNG